MRLDSETGFDVLVWAGWALLVVLAARAAWRLRRAAGWRPGAALALTALLLLAGALEIVLRARGQPTARGMALVGHPLDPVLGWRGKELRGDPATRRPRALVVGDSFTLAAVPEEDAYYAVLRRELGMEPWVFGASGWGTLQEYLVLDREIDGVRPDLVVLQVCANDFINNAWELERRSISNNNASRRPYWEEGRVAWRYPGTLLGARRFLAARSALATFGAVRLHRLKADLVRRGWLHEVEGEIGRRGASYSPFVRAVRTTDDLLRLFVRRCGRVPVVAVPSDSYEPFAGQWRVLLARHGVPLFEDGLRRLHQAHAAGEGVYKRDGSHWSPRGHRYVGELLAAWLKGAPWQRRLHGPLVADLDGDGDVDVLAPAAQGAQAWLLAGARRRGPIARIEWASDEGLLGAGASRAGGPPMLVLGTPTGVRFRTLRAGRPEGRPAELHEPAPPRARLGAFVDFDGDGQSDLLWHDATTRRLWLWRLRDLSRVEESALPDAPPDAVPVGAADCDGDGYTDLVWRDAAGRALFWYLDGVGLKRTAFSEPAASRDLQWQLAAAADFRGGPPASAGVPDLVWHNQAGAALAVWYMDRAGRRVGAARLTLDAPATAAR